MVARLPTVSVVIPCYRYGRFLRACVESVLNQDGVDVRVLIIDDASPDDSATVARALADEHDRVEARVHRVNAGHIATYNEGLLDWAEGEHSILLSADDLLTPGSIRRATDVLDAHPRVAFVYGGVVRWQDGTARPAARTTPTGATVWPGLEWLDIMCRLGHNVVTSPEVVVRTSVQRAVGGYLAALPHTGDAEMWMRCAIHGDVAYIKGADQAYYRTHGTNMTTDRVLLVDLQQRKAAYDALFARYGDRVPDAATLHLRAKRRIAREALWRACRAYERRALDRTPVDDLEQFAAATYPDARRLPEYWGLRWRRVAGPRVAPYLQPVILSAVHRRVRTELWWRHWAREGV